MKTTFLSALLTLTALTATAQNDDPVIMTIAGKDVLRSEFEYSYNKNNSEGVIDKKTVPEYVELFVNYKLKVQAALDEKMDTLSSYRTEFRQYRDQQLLPAMVTTEDVEREARSIYDGEVKRIGPDGLIQPAHIFVRLSPDADKATQDKAKQRIDSLYAAVKAGSDFTDLATHRSDDPGAAAHGGIIGWISHGQTFEEFDKAAFATATGKISEPVLSPAGWHIIRIEGRKQIEPYDSLKQNILTFIERRNLREQIARRKVQSEVEQSDSTLTADEIMDRHARELQARDPELDNLVREYHDGLLLYEISNREVWGKAASDSIGLAQFFKKNKKTYKWDAPRFKGMAYHVKTQADVKAVAKSVKGLRFADWNERLRTTFNPDTIIRIRVEKGLFKQGDNALVDSLVFKVSGKAVQPVAGYPIDAVYGKKIKAPQDVDDVRQQVTEDYQSALERAWVARLRSRYTVQVRDDVVATVNKH